MKNFLIIVLSLGLAVSAFLTRPDREEFERYVRENDKPAKGNPLENLFKRTPAEATLDDVEFKDFFLWTVVKKDGTTLYTGVFDRWIDNQKLKETLPS